MPSKTSSPSTINSLPPELLSKVFAGLRTSTSDLLNCVQCNKTWHELAQATLYRYTVLSSTTISKFTAQCPISVNTDGRITSLTLRLDDVARGADENVRAATREGNRAAQDLWRALGSLGPRLANLNRLRAFSVYHPSNRDRLQRNGFWIPYSALNGLVQNLPPTCISLELDVDTSRPVGGVDLCSSIRRTLPQLEYLRLRLPALCPKICGHLSRSQGDSSTYTVLKDFPEVAAPRLKQCIINMTIFLPGGLTSALCRVPSDGVLFRQRSWGPLTEHIKALVDREKAPLIEKLWLYSSEPLNTGDHTFFVRLLGEVNTDFVSPVADIHDVVEEHSWQQGPGGVRLPAPLMREFGLEPLPRAFTKQQWRESDRPSCMLWSNEVNVGRRLLEVKEGELMEEPTVQEMTPTGWHKDEVGTRLIKDE
ncbi:MAG: hypothetical protein Q9165_002199 [Trypethelium subeluteriae]